MLKRLAPLVLALLLDAMCGEPPARFHPVVWMGRLLEWLEARAPRHETARLLYGIAVAVTVPLAWGWLAGRIERLAPWPMHALALKPAFAGRALLAAGRDVEIALDRHQVIEARHELRSLVSRPTAGLDPPLVAAAAIESLSENLVDSWLSPLLAYGLFGLSGAYAYRAANTADAMWGYRTSRYERLGKAAARLDDVLNFVPARLGAVVLCCVAGHRWRAALQTWRRDGALTSSPNAGQTMASAAGELGVRLEKSQHYVLNTAAPVPGVETIARARYLVARALWLSAGLALLTRLVRRG
ncbi:MAG TPA: adenosylcobinamide-phosphate synthase CbiB [Chloroflexota bacterium]|nr:adenosylcobinamide-phosphate synthase CbiB [Chloroflexota bacterium]